MSDDDEGEGEVLGAGCRRLRGNLRRVAGGDRRGDSLGCRLWNCGRVRAERKGACLGARRNNEGSLASSRCVLVGLANFPSSFPEREEIAESGGTALPSRCCRRTRTVLPVPIEDTEVRRVRDERGIVATHPVYNRPVVFKNDRGRAHAGGIPGHTRFRSHKVVGNRPLGHRRTLIAWPIPGFVARSHCTARWSGRFRTDCTPASVGTPGTRRTSRRCASWLLDSTPTRCTGSPWPQYFSA